MGGPAAGGGAGRGRPRALGGVAFAAVRGAGRPAARPARRGRRPPNVLVVVTDDARAETLQVMPRTRRWLADGGVTFTQGFATTPSCCPSRASILSGRYVHNHGVLRQQLGDRLDQRTTLARYLSGRRLPHGHGRQVPQPLVRCGSPPPGFDRYAQANGGYYDQLWAVDGAVRRVPTYSTTFIGDQALAYLAEFERDDARPWFLYLAPFAPHDPRVPEPRYAAASFPDLERVGGGRRRRRWPARPPISASGRRPTRPRRPSSAPASPHPAVGRRPGRPGPAPAPGHRRARRHPGLLPVRQRLLLGGARPRGQVRALHRVDQGPVPGPLAGPAARRHGRRPAGRHRRHQADGAGRGRHPARRRRHRRRPLAAGRPAAGAAAGRVLAGPGQRPRRPRLGGPARPRLAVHRELRPAGPRRHLPGVLRPDPRPGHGAEPARRRRPRQRPAGRPGRRAGRGPHLHGGELPDEPVGPVRLAGDPLSRSWRGWPRCCGGRPRASRWWWGDGARRGPGGPAVGGPARPAHAPGAGAAGLGPGRRRGGPPVQRRHDPAGPAGQGGRRPGPAQRRPAAVAAPPRAGRGRRRPGRGEPARRPRARRPRPRRPGGRDRARPGPAQPQAGGPAHRPATASRSAT